MIKGGLGGFSGKTILLLQGPVGPFFARLARDFRGAGATVHKINFNGGDSLFYPRGTSYRGSMDDWPAFFERYIVENRVDVIFLFGDCRPIHEKARAIAHQRGLEIGVFEEGYIRPDFITLERYGVNGYSLIPREAAYYRNLPEAPVQHNRRVGNTFWHALMWAMLYYLSASLMRPLYRHYQHHRSLQSREGWPLVISALRKWKYVFVERGIADRLFGSLSQRYFLVPLQVHNDSQIHVHSQYASVKRFILEVIRSFAAHAPADAWLVIKHHPLDRAYHDYTYLIKRMAERKGIAARVLYIHDQHLPSLLQHARGVIVVNSTVGFSALFHRKPVKVCGNALYDMAGLTYQKSLGEFWHEAAEFHLDVELFARYRAYLIQSTQLNGSFFRKLPFKGSNAGLRLTDSS